MVNQSFVFHVPTRIVFGSGKLAELATERLPGKKALLVTSGGGSMKRLGHLDRVLKYLGANGAEAVLFDKIQPNPIEDHVAEGAALARDEGCDFVIGFGGGSPIDSSKAIAIMATNPGSYWDYIATGTGGKKPVQNAPLPIVAIPTTAGTGTEADPWCVITNTRSTEKIGFGLPGHGPGGSAPSNGTFPALSIVDPELMLSVPPMLTAIQGMDAFFHAVEGYLSKARQPASDHFALDAIRLIARNLPRAVAEGSDIQARTAMAWASTQAGIVEVSSSCISHHSMEHALSAYYPDLPHGAGLVMLSRDYFGFMAARTQPDRFATMAKVMAPKGGDDVAALPESKRATAFVRELDRLIHAIGLGDLHLADYGPKKDEAGKFADNAMSAMSRLFPMDPHTLSREDVTAIFEAALSR